MMSNAFGHRSCCMIGAVISAAGLFISAFSPNIYFLYVSYGVILGESEYFQGSTSNMGSKIMCGWVWVPN